MLTITNGRDKFFQWDIGQSLTVEGDVTEVHIGVNKSQLFVAEPIDGTVAVFDELLQQNGWLVAYEYLKNGEDGHTVKKYRFEIVARPKADDYVFTPTESMSWEQWCNRAKEWAEVSKQYAEGIPQTMTDWFESHRDEFKGADGYTPVKGVDYFDGYTPVKGVDYFDGKDGKDGKDAEPYDDTEIREEIASKVGFEDYATNSKGGVIKYDGSLGTSVNVQGFLTATSKNLAQYEAESNYGFISKGTLENVLAERLITKDLVLLQTVVTEEEAMLVVYRPVKELSMAMTVVRFPSDQADKSYYCSFGYEKRFRGVGGAVARDALRAIIRNVGGTWDMYGYIGHSSSGSTGLGPVSVDKVIPVTPSYPSVKYMDLYTFNTPIPIGTKIEFWGMEA